MRGVVDAGEVLEIEMGVYLGGRDIGVSEQFLHRAQVGTGFQQVSGERMTQNVRRQFLPQRLQLDQPVEAALDAACRDTVTWFTQKQGFLIRVAA